MAIPDPRTMAVAQRKPRTKSLVLDTMFCGGGGVLVSWIYLSISRAMPRGVSVTSIAIAAKK